MVHQVEGLEPGKRREERREREIEERSVNILIPFQKNRKLKKKCLLCLFCVYILSEKRKRER
jgi:hypothetical protein